MLEREDKGDSSFVIFLVLAMDDPAPLRGPRSEEGQLVPRMDRGQRYRLVAGLVNPSQETARTPFSEQEFDEDLKDTYNQIADRMEGVIRKFYGEPSGLIWRPDSAGRRCLEALMEDISFIGQGIYGMIPMQSSVRAWFQRIFESKRRSRAASRSVTLITNVFSIPWYWMKRSHNTPLLCELCSLGMLGLDKGFTDQGVDEDSSDEYKAGRTLRAVVMQGATGSSTSLFEEELLEIKKVLNDDLGRGSVPVKVDFVADDNAISGLVFRRSPQELYEAFRIIHYSGHWDRDSFYLGDQRVNVEPMRLIVRGAALMLDGCFSSQKLDAWEKSTAVTSQLLELGALGCVLTVLPVKCDPIAARKFWGTFYKALRRGKATTIGWALTEARRALKLHYRDLGWQNPAWSFYQLIGNPAVIPLRRETDDGG